MIWTSGVRKKKNSKIDTVRLGEIDIHFKRQRDEGVSEGVGKQTPHMLVGESAEGIASLGTMSSYLSMFKRYIPHILFDPKVLLLGIQDTDVLIYV